MEKIEAKVCAFEGCSNTFQTRHGRQIYCSEDCYKKVQNQKSRECNRRRRKRKTENEKDKVCVWCHGVYHSLSKKSSFCSGVCNNKLSRKKSRILTFYMFEGYSQSRVAKEINKLYKLGKNYKITE